MTVRIEPARQADRGVVERFLAAIQEHERRDVPELRPGAEIAASYAALVGEAVLKNDGVLLLAWDGDVPVGLIAAWKAHDDDELLRAEHRAHGLVSDLYVAETHRRAGIARALLAAAETAMRERGCRQMRLTSKANNPAALATYAAAGFGAYEVILWKALDRSG